MYLPDFLNLGIGFQKYFAAVPAVTDELKRAAYRIRHDVYCRDLAYEPVRPDGMETDAYDSHSLQCLLRSKANDEYVGCIRLILARADDPSSLLPIERLCAQTIDRTIVDPLRLPRHTIAEVSRLAVISRYRRRKGEASRPAGITDNDFGTPDRPRFPVHHGRALPRDDCAGATPGNREAAAPDGSETRFASVAPWRQGAAHRRRGRASWTPGCLR